MQRTAVASSAPIPLANLGDAEALTGAGEITSLGLGSWALAGSNEFGLGPQDDKSRSGRSDTLSRQGSTGSTPLNAERRLVGHDNRTQARRRFEASAHVDSLQLPFPILSRSAMHARYEVIDQGGPACKEAREMSVEFTSRNADDYSEKLKRFIAANRSQAPQNAHAVVRGKRSPRCDKTGPSWMARRALPVHELRARTQPRRALARPRRLGPSRASSRGCCVRGS